VTPCGPAAKAGLRAGGHTVRFEGRDYTVGGDVVVKVGGVALRHDTDLSNTIAGYHPGQEIELEIYRGGQRRTVRVKLGERPLERPRRLTP
jgi:S1-C subfamily serine protease